MKLIPGLVLTAFFTTVGICARGQTVAISTTQDTEGGYLGPGVMGDYSYAESVTVPTTATDLKSFTFDSLTNVNGQSYNYQIQVYPFNPSTGYPTGQALYLGPVGTVPATGTVSATITPARLVLAAGQSYLVVINTGSSFAQGSPDGGYGYIGSTTSQTYSGGNEYFTPTDGRSNLFNFYWYNLNTLGYGNAAFTALFGPATTTFATTPGLSPNERGIAGGIDTGSTANSAAVSHVINALSSLPVTSIAGALDELSPAKFSSFASTTAINNAAFDTQDMDIYLQSLRDDSTGGFAAGKGQLDSSGLVVNDPNVDPGLQMIHSRMLAWEDPLNTITDVPGSILGGVDMKDVKQVKTSAASEQPWDVFLRGNVILAQGFSQADVAHFDDNSESVVVGADYHLTPHLLAGVTASYAHTDATLDDFGSSATVDSYSPGVFASWADGGGFVNFMGRYSYNSYTESRAIAFLGQTANGATDGNEGVVDLDGGYDFHSGALTYGPVAGLQYTHLTVNGYTEGGSDAALSVNEDQSDSLRSRLGGSVRYSLNGCGVKFTPHLEATWQHEFLSQDRGLTSQFEDFGGGSFTVRTPNASDDSALVDVGLDAQINQSITVFGDYAVQAGQSNYFGQSIQAGVRVNF